MCICIFYHIWLLSGLQVCLPRHSLVMFCLPPAVLPMVILLGTLGACTFLFSLTSCIWVSLPRNYVSTYFWLTLSFFPLFCFPCYSARCLVGSGIHPTVKFALISWPLFCLSWYSAQGFPCPGTLPTVLLNGLQPTFSLPVILHTILHALGFLPAV
jgi:hypothetical protein